jgi:hypothetical protein
MKLKKINERLQKNSNIKERGPNIYIYIYIYIRRKIMLVDLRVKFKKSNIFEKTNNFNKRPQRKKKAW